MCLSVNLGFHKVKSNKPVALVTKQSILVYKVLSSTDGVHYYTPFVLKSINFDDEYGMFFYKTTRFSFDKEYISKRNYKHLVVKGAHSYVNLARANYDKIFFEILSGSTKNTHIHYAIIPKGSKFYIGNDCDIASSNLVVFENETKYNENKDYFGDEPIEFSEYLKEFGTELDSK